MKNVLFLFAFALAVSACGDSADNSSTNTDPGTYTVEGTVTWADTPVADVEVSVGDFDNLRATTSDDGTFAIDGVPPGEHLIEMRSGPDDSAFAARHLFLAVSDDVALGRVPLPDPVSLDPPTASGAAVDLAWSGSTSDEFREYKVYRHDSSGLDQSTGELIHVATDATVTTFVDGDVLPNQTYFYRVFVMDDYGELGGSNIESVTTPDRNYLANPGFEAIDPQTGFAAEWARQGNPETVVTVDTMVAAEGSNSISMAMPESYEYWVEQTVSTADLEAGDRMILTGKMRSDRADPDIAPSVVIDSEFLVLTVPTTADTWTGFSVEFLVPDSASFDVSVHVIGPFDMVDTTVHVDDLQLRRAP